MANMKDARFIDSQRLKHNLERTCSSIEEAHPEGTIGQSVRGIENSCVGRLKT